MATRSLKAFAGDDSDCPRRSKAAAVEDTMRGLMAAVEDLDSTVRTIEGVPNPPSDSDYEEVAGSSPAVAVLLDTLPDVLGEIQRRINEVTERLHKSLL